LAGQPGYKSRISYPDAEYFNLSAKETRIAKATRPARIPTLEQVRPVIQSMPATTDIERRDRALIAFTILSGHAMARLPRSRSGMSTLPKAKLIRTRARSGRSFSKTFVTDFFPVGDDIRAVVVDWVNYLRQQKLWGLDEPLFPATKIAVGNGLRFEVAGLDRNTGAAPVRSEPYSNKRSWR
jgi:hypothetical protein